jgi:hypothetical protein
MRVAVQSRPSGARRKRRVGRNVLARIRSLQVRLYIRSRIRIPLFIRSDGSLCVAADLGFVEIAFWRKQSICSGPIYM